MSGAFGHTPVLTEAVLRLLSAMPGDVVVDATIGAGGHGRRLAECIGATGRLIGLDVDPASLAAAGSALEDVACRVDLVCANFSELREVLRSLAVGRVDVLLADLGVSSAQLDDSFRGFSFQHDGPLDMRLDPKLTRTAADVVNGLKEHELSDVLYFNAQEMHSRKIARRICAVRREGRITTTAQLSRIVCDVLGVDPKSRRSRIHPATQTFLALRMEVNGELASLNKLLGAAPDILSPGGRFGVIAFHSVEDKLVKVDFRARKAENVYRIVTPKPVVADETERSNNPRSRSAKLRVAMRTGGSAPFSGP